MDKIWRFSTGIASIIFFALFFGFVFFDYIPNDLLIAIALWNAGLFLSLNAFEKAGKKWMEFKMF